MAVTTWSPLKLFALTADDGTRDSNAMLILNCGDSLRGLEKTICEKWKLFSLHVCADGGANSLYDNLLESDYRASMIPEFIVGDLDSVRPEVMKFYKEKGTEVINDKDESSTDFTKSIIHIQSMKQYTSVHVVNTMWGRMDQLMGNLCTLFCFDIQIYLLSETSISFALQKGSHVINVGTGLEEGHCGFFPFCGPCKVCSTTGCRWNLDNECMEVTGLISSCNLIDKEQITVSCSDPLLFTLSHKLCCST